MVEEGRESLAQFPRLATLEISKYLPDPSDPLTFTRCKLNPKERETHMEHYKMYCDLIKLRKGDPVFSQMSRGSIDGAVLGIDSFLIRFFGEQEDRLMIVNFGPDHLFNPSGTLLVAGVGLEWDILWSSDSVKYGGEGTPAIHTPFWKILGHSAIVFKTQKES